MEALKHLCYSFLKGLLWLILSAFFGLIQMWIVLLNNFMSLGASSVFDKIIYQGFLIYFCSGITVSLAIDFHLSDKNRNQKGFDKVMYVLYPFVIILLVFFVGTKFEISEGGTININNAGLIQTIIVYMTIVYALIVKTKGYFVYLSMKKNN